MTTTAPTPTPTGSPTVGVETSVRHPWLVVATREIIVKLTDRNFMLSTALTLVLIAAGVVFSSWMSGRTTEHTVAVATPAAAEIVAAGEEAITADGDALTISEVGSEDAAREAVLAEDADVALLEGPDGWTLLGLSEISSALSTTLTEEVENATLMENAGAAGLTVEELTAGSAVSTELLDDDAGRATMASIIGFAFAFLFYMAAIVFGMTIANSVLEEKQNRVVEILATAIPIRQLLYGKVLGNSLLAFAQIALYAVVALVAVNVMDVAADIGWILGASGWFIAFFVVGFTALAAVWAVLGSLASRSEDLQSNTGPVITVIMVALFVGLFATGTPLAVASYVPVVSSVAMPVRLLSEDVAAWEPIVSLGVTAVVAYLLLRLGERIYQRAVMQGGTALTWRQAMRLEA
ncbi:ABC transporter permease [Georgenia subflava]|uniref:ABC transporter permease n=1 Tax=Georgenia subflava TaxID=1622177 RepID=A0A6N7EHD2_9MICO|nr:ABC transporter permease [Georgenia subflava]MPV36117.1 ABC transporter permease [Georgenia subflava]